MADQLILPSHQVWEALAVSEVLNLLITAKVDVVLVGSDVVNGGEKAAQLGFVAITLEPAATIKEVLWELNCFSLAVKNRSTRSSCWMRF